MSRKILILLMCLFVKQASAQQKIKGQVVEIIDEKESSVPGVILRILDNQQNATTDNEGNFELQYEGTLPVRLSVNFPGYHTDTIHISDGKLLKIILKKSIDLKEVNVQDRREDVSVSTINPLNSEKITERELLKAACCNLSEAFETNPSVNVSYKDAVTGVKEIHLLGLGGTYVQMLAENIPDMRGLAGIYGLTFIPGPWIESIQLSKGSGSVVNGYESTTGQINVEFKKPVDIEQPRYYFNLFGDERGGIEGNIIFKNRVNNYWTTMLMLHGRRMKNEVDRNGDGFMDIPDNTTINIYNRWQYHNTNKNIEGQIGVKFLTDAIEGGQTEKVNTVPLYRTNVNTTRAELNGKLGFVFPEKPVKSIGNIFQATFHDMKSAFGLKTYDAQQRSLYVQSIYQNNLSGNNHLYKIGFTFQYNTLEQQFVGLPDRLEEYIPGIFLEYTYNYIDKFILILGVREDLQDNRSFVFTPRLHGKYNFTENFIFRFSGGKSYRQPYLIADHISVLSSSRQLNITEEILAERAWNYGFNFTIRFNVGEREQSFSADLYRTEFINQLVVDAYTDSSIISFYNLDGESYSNSIQFTWNAEILELLTLRIAYKMDDVRSTFNGVLEQQPLIARNRAMATISYSTPDEHWKFNYTVAWDGTKKLQNVYGNGDNSELKNSPSFSVMNIQGTKVFRKFELYAGAENLLDFRQLNPILHPENPFGNNFDATNIWGPIQGRRIYAGVRVSIN